MTANRRCPSLDAEIESWRLIHIPTPGAYIDRQTWQDVTSIEMEKSERSKERPVRTFHGAATQQLLLIQGIQ